MPSWPGPVGPFSSSTVPEDALSNEILQNVRAHDERKIWIPGKGDQTVGVEGAQRVISEYDERLTLARHNVTGDWVVFIKIDRDTLYPVIGLGPELPSPDEIGRRLYNADAARHGTKLLDQVNRHNDAIRKAKRAAADEALGEAAEVMEFGYRKDGEHPSPRIFVP